MEALAMQQGGRIFPDLASRPAFAGPARVAFGFRRLASDGIQAPLTVSSKQNSRVERVTGVGEEDPVQVFAKAAAAPTHDSKSAFFCVAADPFGEVDFENQYHQDQPYLIWNRASYKGLSSRIEELLLKGYTRFIILGTAGIGKTWFAVTWVLKCAAEGLPVVLKQDAEFSVLDFSKQPPLVSAYCKESDSLVQKYLNSRSTWLVINGKQGKRLRYKCRMLVACSTKPSNFEEFRKHSRAVTLYLPVWTEEELSKFFEDFEPYRNEYSTMGIHVKDDAMEVFQLVGGIPRYVLDSKQAPYGISKLTDAVSSVSIVIDTAVQALSGAYVGDMSDRILHIHVEDDYSKALYELASDYVRESIKKQLAMANSVRIASLLSSTYDKKNLGVLWGMCFEVQAHRILSAGGDIRIKRVYPGGRSDPVTMIKLRPHVIETLIHSGDVKAKAAFGVYLIPGQKTFPSVDALLGYKLIQIFKRFSGKHGFKAAGLLTLDKELGLESYELFSCVPPEQFDKTGFQDYLTADNNRYMGSELQKLDKFQQYVCEIDYKRMTS